MPVRTPICPEVGFTKRALRFFNEDEIFVGIGVGDPWDDEDSPPTLAIGARGLGYIENTSSHGATLDEDNCSVEFNLTCFQAGIESYKIIGIGSNQYEIIRVSDDSVLATGLAGSATGRQNVVDGLTFTVTATSITEDDYMIFKVDGPIAFKKCETVKLVVPDDDGEIEYYNGNFREVTEENAFIEKVRHVYVEAVFRYDQHPLVDYRQVAVFTGLVRADGVSGSKNNLLPSEVETSGWVEMLVNDVAVVREIQDRQYHTLIVEF